MFQFNKNKCVSGENTFSFFLVNMCEDTHMTAPATVKLLAVFFCWATPENAVGMAAGREWEREREIMERQRLQEREWERHRRSERQETRKRGRSESRLMWKCLRSPRASPPPPRSVSLYLFHPFFHSHWHSSLGAPFWRPVSIGDSSGDASAGAHTSAHASSPCQRKFKLEL